MPRGAAVDQPRDVGMVQRRQDLALVAEALEQERVGEAAADDLDGDALPELAVVTLGEIDACPCRRSPSSRTIR